MSLRWRRLRAVLRLCESLVKPVFCGVIGNNRIPRGWQQGAGNAFLIEAQINDDEEHSSARLSMRLRVKPRFHVHIRYT
jgi:hypothetical protein